MGTIRQPYFILQNTEIEPDRTGNLAALLIDALLQVAKYYKWAAGDVSDEENQPLFRKWFLYHSLSPIEASREQYRRWSERRDNFPEDWLGAGDIIFNTETVEQLVVVHRIPLRRPSIDNDQGLMAWLQFSIAVECKLQDVINAWHREFPKLPLVTPTTKTTRQRGRPKGSLSAASLPPGMTVDQIVPFLRKARQAWEAQDGSFAKMCREAEHKESTVRYWLEQYAEIIDRN